ncbi:MAG: prepilin-type N-terminal cleavage/methylation domain-containing protein [Candidatus Omnitrophica bacterium]|nr:prepilin-type N-terminal cleavage/methylation domain-containing protein [Candidatus Omnitrophota bacterium]
MKKKDARIQGFSLVETVVVMAISTVVVYGVYIILFSCSDAVQLSAAQVELQNNAQRAVSRIIPELRESNLDNITGFPAWAATATGTAIDLIDDQAVVFSSARDTLGDFQMDGTEHTADWQGVVAFCPFADNDVRQLRQYRVFGAYDFPVTVTNVDSTQITLNDNSGTAIIIDRDTGAPGIYNVLANNFNRLTFIAGNPVTIIVITDKTTVKNRNVSFSLTTNAVIKN